MIINNTLAQRNVWRFGIETARQRWSAAPGPQYMVNSDTGGLGWNYFEFSFSGDHLNTDGTLAVTWVSRAYNRPVLLAVGGVARGGPDDVVKSTGGPGFASPAAPDDPNKAAEKDFFERYKAWLDSPEAQKLDVRTLPRAYLLAEFKPSQPNLAAATASADVIAVGEAVEYKFGSWGSSVTLTVESMLKGSSASTLTVSLPGGPQPNNLAFTDVTLVEGEAAPILLPGDRALLFLERSNDGKRLNVQPYSGHYRLDRSNKVVALPQNAFGREVSGMNVDDFTRVVRELLRRLRLGPPSWWLVWWVTSR